MFVVADALFDTVAFVATAFDEDVLDAAADIVP